MQQQVWLGPEYLNIVVRKNYIVYNRNYVKEVYIMTHSIGWYAVAIIGRSALCIAGKIKKMERAINQMIGNEEPENE